MDEHERTAPATEKTDLRDAANYGRACFRGLRVVFVRECRRYEGRARRVLVRTRHSNLPAGLADGLEVGVLYRIIPDTPPGAGIAPLGPPRRNSALGLLTNLRLCSPAVKLRVTQF
jgi:hypothetical protein